MQFCKPSREQEPINIASTPHESVKFLIDSEDQGAGVVTSKPVYNYDAVKYRNLPDNQSDALFSYNST